LGERIRSALFPSLRGYERAWAVPDLVAALALLAIAIPEQLATSRLAGMPPITGYYAFVAGTVAFAVLGSNRQMSVGADSTIAPLFAVGVAHIAGADATRYLELVAILAVMVGAIVGLVGALRLGWIAEFLSVPIVTGFLSGVAVIIVVHQLPDLLGLPAQPGSNVHRLGYVAGHLQDINGWSLALGLIVLAVVVAADLIDRRIPGALLGLVLSGVLVSAFDLTQHGVAVLGTFPHGPPHWGLEGLSWSTVRRLGPLAAVVALVVISQTAATTRAFADQGGYDVDVNRDFVGVGTGSVLAGFAGAFPVDASPPRTAAVARAGGRTQAAGLGAAAGLILLIPAASLLKNVPLAALAAILMFVAARLFHIRDLVSIAHFDLFEFGLALVTLVTVAFVGVQQGIAVAVLLAILDRTRLSARPQLHVLGQIPGTTSWVPLGSKEGPVEVPAVLVVLFATPLWYANASHFRAQFHSALHRRPEMPRAVVLDAIGMSDIDFTGGRAMHRVLDELERAGIAFGVARAGEHARTSLRNSSLAKRIGEDRLFAAVNEAVTALGPADSGFGLR
jgi:high affinity sulfate transporter 1